MVTMTTDFAAENQYINARDTYEQRGGGKLPFPARSLSSGCASSTPAGPGRSSSSARHTSTSSGRSKVLRISLACGWTHRPAQARLWRWTKL